MEISELLLHPVRMRLVQAMADTQPRTTGQLCSALPDVSKATVYRHVQVLADAGVLTVESEQRVRGAVERTYRLQRERAALGPDEAAGLTPDDFRRAFALTLATLQASFSTYLDSLNADPAADGVGFGQHALWLDPSELATLITGLRAAIAPHLANEPNPHRTRYLLSPVLFPTTGPARGENGYGVKDEGRDVTSDDS